MREVLYSEFLYDRFTNSTSRIQAALLLHGIEGMLNDFEEWLVKNGHIK